MKNIYIIGAGGHAKVVIDILLKNKKIDRSIMISGILDDSYKEEELIKLHGIPIIGNISKILELNKSTLNYFIIAIGSNEVRKKIDSTYELNYFKAIHPTAIIGNNVEIGEGTVVMANVVINSYSQVGKNCIINSMSLIEHDCLIEDYVHLSPSVSLAGNVVVREKTWIGIGSNIIQGIEIKESSIIGAGSVVVKNISANSKAYGNPCKEIKK